MIYQSDFLLNFPVLRYFAEITFCKKSIIVEGEEVGSPKITRQSVVNLLITYVIIYQSVLVVLL